MPVIFISLTFQLTWSISSVIRINTFSLTQAIDFSQYPSLSQTGDQEVKTQTVTLWDGAREAKGELFIGRSKLYGDNKLRAWVS